MNPRRTPTLISWCVERRRDFSNTFTQRNHRNKKELPGLLGETMCPARGLDDKKWPDCLPLMKGQGSFVDRRETHTSTTHTTDCYLVPVNRVTCAPSTPERALPCPTQPTAYQGDERGGSQCDRSCSQSKIAPEIR